MPDHRAGIIARLVLIAICIAVLHSGCARKPPAKRPATNPSVQQPKPEPERTKLEATFEGARVTWDDDEGNRLWEASFSSATAAGADGSSTTVELQNVEAGLYRDGKVVSRMVAPRVVADSGKKEIRASGGVKVTSLVDKTSATAGEMVWKPRDNTITGTGGVRMDKGNIRIRARSIVTDTALRKAKLSDAEAVL